MGGPPLLHFRQARDRLEPEERYLGEPKHAAQLFTLFLRMHPYDFFVAIIIEMYKNCI